MDFLKSRYEYRKYFIILTLVFLAMQAVAQISPGELSKPHESLQGIKNCTKCHELGKKISPSYCLDCHSLLRDRIEKGLGLHANKEYVACEECHHEHQGRDFNLVWWKDGQENFDHKTAGYSLIGKHLGLDCRICHNSRYIKDRQRYLDKNKQLDKTFLGLDRKCLSCHYDEHRGQLSTDCLNCHEMLGWKSVVNFDHNVTKFRLDGKHKQIACQACHIKEIDNKSEKDKDYLKFSGLNYQKCINCHNDPHRNRFGIKCENCHNTTGWSDYNSNRFDHDRTGYSLKGKHVALTCSKCHIPGKPLKIEKFKSCQDCHFDYHLQQFSHRPQKGACEECHTVYGFKPAQFSIEQHQLTQYPLQGAHLAIPCISCHTNNYDSLGVRTIRYRFASLRCINCHKDPHKGEVAKYLAVEKSSYQKKGCEHCHSIASWKDINFDHDPTGFILKGKHQTIRCVLCHSRNNTVNSYVALKFKGLSRDCANCHVDEHQGQFDEEIQASSNPQKSTHCEHCHTPVDWLAEGFIHNRDAKFKIEGAHRYLKCSQCHKEFEINGKKTVRYKPMDSSCSACHAKRTMKEAENKS